MFDFVAIPVDSFTLFGHEILTTAIQLINTMVVTYANPATISNAKAERASQLQCITKEETVCL